jgi:AAA domain
MTRRPPRKAQPASPSDADEFMEEMGSFPSLGDIEEREIEWVWKGILPQRKLAILDGDGGLGKSQVALDIMARITKGRAMPMENEDITYDPMNVVILSAEDDAGDTLRPRLRVAGADLFRVFPMLVKRDENGNPIPLTFPEGMNNLRRIVNAAQPILVVVDPITAYLGEKILTGVDSSVRKALAPLADLADQANFACLLVRHINKNTSMKAAHRGGGSLAFLNLCRSGLIAGRMPGYDDLFAIAQVKNNLRPLLDGAMTYSVVVRELSEINQEEITGIEWREWAGVTADDLMREPGIPKGPTPDKRDACVADVLALLDERDPYNSDELKAELKAKGHREGTIKNASAECKKTHGVQTYPIHVRGRIDHWEVTRKPLPKGIRGRKQRLRSVYQQSGLTVCVLLKLLNLLVLED